MPTDFIKPAERMKPFKPYYFATLGKRITALRAEGHDIIRLDMGSPDLPPAEFIMQALADAAKDPKNHGYTPYGGSPIYRQSISSFYKRRFNVDIDPQNEVVGLIGSKEGLFDLPMVLANPGDVVLMPDPGYPVYKSGADMAKAEIFKMPLLKENNFLPDIEAIPEEIARRAKILWINYPNNPTGAIAPLEFYEKIIAYAIKHEIVIAHDAPYSEICYDGYVAPSIMQIPGAKEVAVEFNSLSKAYNMGGWRLGMAVGNPKVVNLINTLKSQMDNSHFEAVYKAGAIALTGDQTWLVDRNSTYKKRRDIVLNTLRPSGFTVDTPPATIYLWAQLPERFKDEVAFCNKLLLEAGVSLTPGSVFGEYGKSYLRISLGTETPMVEEAMRRLAEWIKKN